MRDVGRAEELAQDALVAALTQWPESGVPDNPGAWLMATAKHHAINHVAREKRIERKHEELGRRIEAEREAAEIDPDAAIDDDVGDDLLRLMFIACHPVLAIEARVALTLRLLGEAHGLVALMELSASRAPARTGPSGEPVLLLDQNRARWDRLLIERGLAALARAEALGGAAGPYALQAAIAACHARARAPEDTEWTRIAALYSELEAITGSPVVALNRAVAVAMAEGPAAGLALVDALASEKALSRSHLLPIARGDLLSKLGRLDEARAEFERAAALTRNTRERDVLLGRAAACARAG